MAPEWIDRLFSRRLARSISLLVFVPAVLAAAESLAAVSDYRLFAAVQAGNGEPVEIVELDPATGVELNRLVSPEAENGSRHELVLIDRRLYVVPIVAPNDPGPVFVYVVDPDSGDLLAAMPLPTSLGVPFRWFGFEGDLAMVRGDARTIIRLDPETLLPRRTVTLYDEEGSLWTAAAGSPGSYTLLEEPRRIALVINHPSLGGPIGSYEVTYFDPDTGSWLGRDLNFLGFPWSDLTSLGDRFARLSVGNELQVLDPEGSVLSTFADLQGRALGWGSGPIVAGPSAVEIPTLAPGALIVLVFLLGMIGLRIARERA